MSAWSEYLKNSFGLRIFFGVCLLLGFNITISRLIEKKRINDGIPKEDHKTEMIKTIKRLWIGMLTGFVVSVTIVVTLFIVRNGYFSLLEEIGAVTVGLIGAVIGGLCGIVKWRRKES